MTAAEALLRAIVLAWDADDEVAFEMALTVARAHLGVTEPSTAPCEVVRPSSTNEADIPLPFGSTN